MGGFVDAIFGGGGGGGAPSADPGLKESAEAAKYVGDLQRQTAQEYLAFAKQQYADMLPLAQKYYDEQTKLSASQRAIADKNAARADEYADYEKNTFRPLETQIVQDAQNYDTEAKREQLASRGMADVATAYQQQRQQALDTLAKYGINPNSARFAAINAQLDRGEAADKAGAANNARLQAEQLGYARKLDAASLGRNLASNASTAYGVSLNAGNSSGQNSGAGLDAMYRPGATLSAGYGLTSNIYGGAANAYGTAGNIYGTEFGTRMQGYSADQQASAASASGFGNMVGRLGAAWIAAADGGKIHVGKGAVRGPGGPVDDKVPAMLSNGEYVLPEDTVKAIGKKKLDKLVKQTHTPAAIQRRRTALQGGQ